MAIDIINDHSLAETYANILSRDETTRHNAEHLVAIRICSARIWQIFQQIHLALKQKHNARLKDAKTKEILAQIQSNWRRFSKTRHAIYKYMPNDLYEHWAAVQGQWQDLTFLARQLVQQLVTDKDNVAGPFKYLKQLLPEQNLFYQLAEEHAKNIIRLAETKNALSESLKNSLLEGKGTKFRLQKFFSLSLGDIELYEQMVSKFPQLKNLSRSELTNAEITELQIRTYIKFLDNKNDEQIWRRAKYLLDILAFYQWLKNKDDILMDKQVEVIKHLELYELLMDSVPNLSQNEINNDMIIQMLYEQKRELFPNLNIVKFSNFSNFDSPQCGEADAKSAHQFLHGKILQKLGLNSEFLTQLKEICADIDRLHGLCNEPVVEQIIMKNCCNKLKMPKTDAKNSHLEEIASSSSPSMLMKLGKCTNELSNLMTMYKNVMFKRPKNNNDSDGIILEKAEQYLNFEAIYFHHKTVLKELVKLLGVFQRYFKHIRINDEKVKRLIIQLNVDIAMADLFVEANDPAKKRANLCLMDSLLTHLMANGTLFTEVEEWQTHMLYEQFINNNEIPRPSDADLRWAKPECHKAEVAQAAVSKLLGHMHLVVQSHSFVLRQVAKDCAEFVQFVNQNGKGILKNLYCENIAFNERITYYKTILGSSYSEERKVAEALLVIKMTFSEILQIEKANFKASKFDDQIGTFRAELIALMKMLQIVIGETKAITLISNDPPGDQIRFKHRLSADLMVWMCRFEHLLSLQLPAVRHEIEKIWLFFRCYYDIISDFEPPISTEIDWNLAAATNELILKIEHFVEMHKNETDSDKVLKHWQQLIKSNFEDGILTELADKNSKNEDQICAEHIEYIQKLHLLEFIKLINSKNNYEKWDQIINVLSTNREQRKNILQFLTLDHVKILFKKLSIEFDNKDFLEKNKQIENQTKTNNGNFEEKAKESVFTNTNNENKSLKRKKKNPEKNSDNNANKSINNNELIIINSSAKKNSSKNELIKKDENKMKTPKKEEIKIVNKKEKLKEKCRNHLFKEWERIGPVNLSAFLDDSFLYGKYAEFLSSPLTDGQIVLLDIGAYVNEIEKRIQMWQQLQIVSPSLFGTINMKKQLDKVNQEWKTFLNTEYNNVDVVCALPWQFHQILWKILNLNNEANLMLAEAANEIVIENFENELKNVKAQIHLENFAMALLTNGATISGKWEQIESKKRQKLLEQITGMRCGHIRFDNLKLRWQKMEAQIQLDQSLFSKLLENEQNSNKYLSANFPKFSQQINFAESIKNDTQNVQNLENYLAEKTFKGFAEYEEKMKNSLIKIRKMFHEWSEGHAKLLVSGSFLLGTHTIRSDIDLLCIVPGKVIKKMHIFGTDTTLCQQMEHVCSDGTNWSLYCELCSNEIVTDLVKFPHAPILLIKFIFDQVPYDVTFVIIPERKTLPPKIDDKTMDELMAKFKKPTENNIKMLRVLSGYRSTFYIFNLILDGQNKQEMLQMDDGEGERQKIHQKFNKNAKNFRMLILVMKLWAKSNYIYSNKYGYLNGAILTIMVTKIVLLYPNASLPFLIQKFFLFYSTRPIFMPVQLSELDKSNIVNPFFVQNPEEQEMPVYTPIFPELNVASLVTNCSAKVIRKEMTKALKMTNLIEATHNFEWKTLLHEQNDGFIEKYPYFVLINCVAEQQTQIFDKFCQFVDGRIRRQIVYDLDPKNGPNIGTHLYPDIYQHNCEMANEFLALAFKPDFCKVWLIGISSKVNRAQMNPLLAQFDAAIRKDFFKFNPLENGEENGGKNKNNKKFKMPNMEEIGAKFEEFKLAFKSILVNKWEMFEAM
ncbi:hypothetical protein niasHS_005474 [Heterodera schachtii]|uniref:polynucleotide adenylyltransferase n=1 Tax=Heterodera schachtii TaxID=97005 RepID=A0ABD2JJ43_HETSC